MKNSSKYQGIKYTKRSSEKTDDLLTVEAPLQITINEKPFTVVMQTPGDEITLATGLLYAEDVIDQSTSFEITTTENKRGQIETVIFQIPEDQIRDGYKSSRSLLSVSSCGICGKQSLEDLPHFDSDETLPADAQNWSLENLLEMQEKMFNAQSLFQSTGGCHGVAAFNTTGDLLSIREDVGRHNALDKVVGNLLQNNKLKEAKVLAFSGRVSYEIVSKAFRAKIRLIIAVSAPSSLAIDFAKEFGITILAFARNSKATCYSHCQRIRKS